MADPRVVKLARVLVEYCCEVQPGDLVSISGMPPAKPLLQEIYRETLRAGYPETGSLNKSAIHMDMICDMRQGGQLIFDGELIYDSGEFKI